MPRQCLGILMAWDARWIFLIGARRLQIQGYSEMKQKAQGYIKKKSRHHVPIVNWIQEA